MAQPYDALLVVSFGGPDGPDDVLPFLENVLRGRNVPRDRMLEVAEHYYKLGGRSPINDQNRALIAAIEKEFAEHDLKLPIFWGNRNWHPLLPDTVRNMAAAGVRRALAFVTSAYSSYSSCRQYRENIAAAQAVVGPGAPQVDKLRAFFNHPGFIEPMIERTQTALESLLTNRRGTPELIFTAHSIPLSMAAGCQYREQLRESCRLVVEGLESSRVLYRETGMKISWNLVYQSRSGPPTQPWLEPDICEFIESRQHELASRAVVIVPIGFISDHMEVVYDLDTEARQLCERLGIRMVRAATVGTHPRFVRMIRELALERMTGSPSGQELDPVGSNNGECRDDCCPLISPISSGQLPNRVDE
jgi:protoporphyrin/coproporphyrin ferrochelatase